MQVLCRKGKARRWEYGGGELFAGLGLIAMVLVGSLLPLDVTLFYIRLIFWGIGVGFACLLAAVGVAHLRFERLPDCLLVLKDCKTLQDFTTIASFRLPKSAKFASATGRISTDGSILTESLR